MKTIFLAFCFTVFASNLQAQFAPQAGIAGSTAIHKGSSQIVGWATNCIINRGWMDIANLSLGLASAGDSSNAVGVADNLIVSLGDSGIATLSFASPIINGLGADFAIFENGFLNATNNEEAFLELAFVEVSSNGINFFRFPTTCNTQDTQQITGTGMPNTGDYIKAREINNLAGKYIANYGTPFDLDELKNTSGLNVNHITHIRIIDVIGDVSQHSSYDSEGNKINDPYPTPFPTSGFDLDAVAVLHQVSTSTTELSISQPFAFYPNPMVENLYFSTKENLTIHLVDAWGRVAFNKVISQSETISLSTLQPGIYYLLVKDNNNHQWKEKIIKLP